MRFIKTGLLLIFLLPRQSSRPANYYKPCNRSRNAYHDDYILIRLTKKKKNEFLKAQNCDTMGVRCSCVSGLWESGQSFGDTFDGYVSNIHDNTSWTFKTISYMRAVYYRAWGYNHMCVCNRFRTRDQHDLAWFRFKTFSSDYTYIMYIYRSRD